MWGWRAFRRALRRSLDTLRPGARGQYQSDTHSLLRSRATYPSRCFPHPHPSAYSRSALRTAFSPTPRASSRRPHGTIFESDQSASISPQRARTCSDERSPWPTHRPSGRPSTPSPTRSASSPLPSVLCLRVLCPLPSALCSLLHFPPPPEGNPDRSRSKPRLNMTTVQRSERADFLESRS